MNIQGYLLPNDPEEKVKEMADLFGIMNSELQAMFFNQIAETAEQWPGMVTTQWCYLVNDLSPAAKKIFMDMNYFIVRETK